MLIDDYVTALESAGVRNSPCAVCVRVCVCVSVLLAERFGHLRNAAEWRAKVAGAEIGELLQYIRITSQPQRAPAKCGEMAGESGEGKSSPIRQKHWCKSVCVCVCVGGGGGGGGVCMLKHHHPNSIEASVSYCIPSLVHHTLLACHMYKRKPVTCHRVSACRSQHAWASDMHACK